MGGNTKSFSPFEIYRPKWETDQCRDSTTVRHRERVIYTVSSFLPINPDNLCVEECQGHRGVLLSFSKDEQKIPQPGDLGRVL